MVQSFFRNVYTANNVTALPTTIQKQGDCQIVSAEKTTGRSDTVVCAGSCPSPLIDRAPAGTSFTMSGCIFQKEPGTDNQAGEFGHVHCIFPEGMDNANVGWRLVNDLPLCRSECSRDLSVIVNVLSGRNSTLSGQLICGDRLATLRDGVPKRICRARRPGTEDGPTKFRRTTTGTRRNQTIRLNPNLTKRTNVFTEPNCVVIFKIKKGHGECLSTTQAPP